VKPYYLKRHMLVHKVGIVVFVFAYTALGTTVLTCSISTTVLKL
jgi:hypothetical protein